MWTWKATRGRGTETAVARKRVGGRIIWSIVAATVLPFTIPPAGLGAAAPLPTPGSASQIARLVSTSHSIAKLPSNLSPPLAEVDSDDAWAYFKLPLTCPNLTSCPFGDTTAKRTIVLFGDSHSVMWLPAIDLIAREHAYKLVLLWMPRCPSADVTYWDPASGSYDMACNTWRSATITAIKASDPALVLLASQTADRYVSPHVLFTDAQWRAGLVKTIDALKSATTKVAVIGDIPMLNHAMPECLAAFPTKIQRCGVAIPNPVLKNRGHQKGEAAAAKATGALYVNTLPWLCTRTACSPVIGHLAVYVNAGHVTATYAYFLSTVLATALSPDL